MNGREATFRSVAVAQGITYVATGLWPVVHLRSFEAVTGPKLEGWLVKTVGLLVTAIGATLLVGATSAAALAGVDVYYAGKRRIKPVYFADAALELAFVVGWLVRRPRAASLRARTSSSGSPRASSARDR
jgi:hypothetical protein